MIPQDWMEQNGRADHCCEHHKDEQVAEDQRALVVLHGGKQILRSER